MAFERFWWDVHEVLSRWGADPHLTGTTTGDGPRTIHLDVMLTPAVVGAYDPNDFVFLPADQRKELEDAVQAFREATKDPSPDGEAFEAQVEDIRKAFASIARILAVGEFDGPVEYKVAKILDSYKGRIQRAAPWVTDFVAKVEEDSSNKDAVWIWTIVDDNFADSPQFFDESEQLREELEKLLRIQGIDCWVHVRFRSKSEQEEEEEEDEEVDESP